MNINDAFTGCTDLTFSNMPDYSGRLLPSNVISQFYRCGLSFPTTNVKFVVLILGSHDPSTSELIFAIQCPSVDSTVKT